MRPRHEPSASRAEMSRPRIAVAMRVAVQRQMSSLMAIGSLRSGPKRQGLRVEGIPATLARRISSGANPGKPAGKPMSLIAVGGFQHETNTFAPSKADFTAFEDGGGWPPLTSGAEIAPRLSGANLPGAGRLDQPHALGHRTVGLVWGAASPSAHVTSDAYERIAGDMLARLEAAGPGGGG